MDPTVARLARHLSARLEELEDACILLRGWDGAADGRVEARFPGQDSRRLAQRVRDVCLVDCQPLGDDGLVFRLTQDTPFESLDAVWGVLFESAP